MSTDIDSGTQGCLVLNDNIVTFRLTGRFGVSGDHSFSIFEQDWRVAIIKEDDRVTIAQASDIQVVPFLDMAIEPGIETLKVAEAVRALFMDAMVIFDFRNSNYTGPLLSLTEGIIRKKLATMAPI